MRHCTVMKVEGIRWNGLQCKTWWVGGTAELWLIVTIANVV